jgi:exodeoxyribonuclease VII large subunit
LAVQRSVTQLGQIRQRLGAAGRAAVAGLHQRLALAARALHTVSPLATLDRGYAIVTDATSDDVLMRASDVSAGDDIRARLSRGKLLATVKQVIDDGE